MTAIVITIVARVITLKTKSSKKKQTTDTKQDEKRIKRGAIEKCPILPSQYWKNE